MKHLDYKGYTGTIEYSTEDKLLFGKVVGIKGLISYEGTTGTELEANFKSTIDDYLADCKEDGITPEKPFKGSFNVRIAAELHRSLAITAMELGTSQSLLVGESIKTYLATVHTKLATIRGKDPDKYRQDKLGNEIYYGSYVKNTEKSWEIDHSKPECDGGTDHLNNLQALQTNSNRKKGC